MTILASSMTSRFLIAACFLLILLMTIAVTGRFIDQKFIWYVDYPSAAFATTGLNHVRYGLSRTKGAMVTNTSVERPSKFFFNFHHPPALALVLGAAYAVFGEQEYVGRSVLVFFSLANILLLYCAAALFVGRRIALAAASIAAFLPAQLFFATRINHDPMTLTFILAAIVAYGIWRRAPSSASFAVLAIIICIGTTVDWPAYYVAGLLPVFHFVQARIEQRKLARPEYRVFFLPLLAVIMFALFLLHAYVVTSGTFESFLQLALERSGLTEGADYGEFSNFALVLRSSKRLVNLFTFPAAALAFVSVVMSLCLVTDKSQDVREAAAFLLLLAAIGLTHPLLFRHVVWVHEHLLYFMLPATAVGAAMAVDWMLRCYKPSRIAVPLALLSLLFFSLALFQTKELYWYGKTEVALDVADDLKKSVPPNGLVFSNATTHPYYHTAIPYYSGRTVMNHISDEDTLRKNLAELDPSTRVFVAIFASEEERSRNLVDYVASRWTPLRFPWGYLYELPLPLPVREE